jgi:hypothetical protein
MRRLLCAGELTSAVMLVAVGLLVVAVGFVANLAVMTVGVGQGLWPELLL